MQHTGNKIYGPAIPCACLPVYSTILNYPPVPALESPCILEGGEEGEEAMDGREDSSGARQDSQFIILHAKGLTDWKALDTLILVSTNLFRVQQTALLLLQVTQHPLVVWSRLET